VRTTTITVGGVVRSFITTTLADTTAPVISLVGGNTSWQQGTTWEDPGYSATDNADGSIDIADIQVIGTVNTDVIAPYSIIYRAVDLSGNIGETSRTVTVVAVVPGDDTGPIITITGGNLPWPQSEPWVDPGYYANDNVDGLVPASEFEIIGAPDVSTPGTYTVLYRVYDQAGNMSEASRTITVIATPSPGAGLLLSPFRIKLSLS
jgi:hypothetical protein